MLRQLLTLIAILGCFEIYAQSINGIGYSSYGGVQNLDVTPVSIGSVYKADVNLFAGTLQRQMYGANFIALSPRASDFNRSWNKIGAQFDTASFTPGASVAFDEVRSAAGPSFFYASGKMGGAKRAFGLVTGFHSMLQLRNFNADVLQWDFTATSTESQGTYNMRNVALRKAIWAEYGVNYSETVFNRGKHEVSVGATFKLYQGLNAFVANFDQLSVGFNNKVEGDMVSVTLQANQGNILHSAGEFMGQDEKGRSYSNSGLSIGGDVGFTYSFKPKFKEALYAMDDSMYTDQSSLNYFLRLGASVKNLGSLTFKSVPDANGSLPAAFRDLNYTYSGSSILSDKDLWDAMESEIQSDGWLQGYSSATGAGESSFRMGLPTTLNLFADMNLVKGLGASVQAIIPVTDPGNLSTLQQPAMVQFIPKFERPKRGFYVPIMYNEWSQYTIGVAARFGNFSIALSNVLSTQLTVPYQNAAISFGLRVPILHKRHEDPDNDKVSTLLDECPTQPGPMSAKGCPDADFDGIRDDEDRCQQKAGLAERQGCPDQDMDGIIDDEDGCPAHFGPEVGTVKKGCPDADGDGFVDDGVADKCPDRAGHVNGCPDSDEDGVMDDEDKCKHKGGKPEDLEEGCPDTDGDGQHDHKDDCDEEVGQPENGGCPQYDYDDDNVLDYKDRCQTIPGVKENDGCPADEEIAINISESVIYFTEGEALSPTAIAELKEVAKDLVFELQADPDIKIELKGHAGLTELTDDKQALSLRRAEAVKAFLIAETGIAAVSFYPQGFADREGVMIKAYPTGEYPDRRVEIVLAIPDEK